MLKLSLTDTTLEISGDRGDPDFEKINAELINLVFDKIIGVKTLVRCYNGFT